MKRNHISTILSFSFFLLLSFSLLGQSKGVPLKMDTRIEQALTAGETHYYTIELKKNQFFLAELMQDGIDIMIAAYDPEGEKIADFDSPNGNYGAEPINISTKKSGSYRLEVKALNEDAEPGRYKLYIQKQEALAKTPEGKIDQLFAAWDRPDSPGASVAVVQNGKIVFKKGYGAANLEYDVPNTPSTIFHIASVSKQFTAFAIAMLAEKGKIALDDDIRKYLPEIPDFGEKITIRHLVHHISGMRDQWNLLAMAGWRLDDVITKEQVLKLLSHQQDLNFKPGEEYLYCNSGFTLMAEIVARVSDQSFAEWTAENIFKPLGMNNTLFYDDHQKIVKNRAYSYFQDQNNYKKSVLSYANVGATSLFTTVEDLSKWALNFEKMTVGNQSVMELMHERGVLNNGEKISYAFGQVVGEYKGLKTVSHGGADAGYRTYFSRFPEQRFAVVVFSNLASFNTGGMALKIADIYLGDHMEKPAPKEEKKAEKKENKGEEVQVSKELLDAYAGQYELNPGFIITVKREGDRLSGQATGQPKFMLTTASENEFFVPEVNATLVFQKSDEGNVNQMLLKQNGREIILKRLESFDPEAVDISLFTGKYYSPELQTTYTFLIEEDKLIARHQRHPDIELKVAKPDFFSGNTWFFGQVEFVRNDQKEITGCKVSNGRVRNLRFEKVDL